ncbi:MAG: U32 family peptidase [Clostridia bacterium]|nr:U32 family peptidase [Clostridia bacterium]
MKLPELLSPAGNLEKLKAALRYGADAVYVGGLRFGMRSASQNFSAEQLDEAIKYTHERGRRLYVTVNTLPRGYEYPELRRYLSALGELCPDGIIVADLGVMTEAKKLIPHIPIHISTQTSIVSPAAALAYASLGATRLVLARELSLEDIKEIRAALPREIEIEAFVHGSMCVSYSGRCMLSNFFSGRDANRGQCTQPCRWNYVLYEEKRPDQPLPIEQDCHGTYIMSSKDMCTIEHIPELVEAGINSFKIEGRVKSAYYTAVVTNAYRMALDAYAANPEGYTFDSALMGELESVSHREYCTGYYFDDPLKAPQLTSTVGYIRDKAYLASAEHVEVDTLPDTLSQNADGLYLFCQHNKLCVGDCAEVISPGKVGRAFTVTELYDAEGNAIDAAPHPSMKFYTRVPFPVLEGDIMRAANAPQI